MKTAVVYSSVTGNTKKLAERIAHKVGAQYCGETCDKALEAETVYVGFWTTKSSCGADIKAFLEQLDQKKVFIFGTAGYNNTKEYFEGILKSVEAIVPSSNMILGTYMCQGKVSEVMKERIKEGRPEMYEAIKEKLDEAEQHPNESDLEGLEEAIEKLG